MPTETKANFNMSSIFVETTQTKYACTRIDELIRDGWEEDYCMALVLLGLSRSGKSRLVRDLIETRVGRDFPKSKVPPIVYVEVPARATLTSFPTAVLNALHDPDPGYGDPVDRTRRIGEAIRRHSVQLLIFDEFQRLINFDTDKVKTDVAIWVAGLLNQRVCPILLVGEPKAENIFINNMHLEGRTFGQIDVRPYDWADEAQRREFATIMYQIDCKLELPELSGLGVLRTAQRIHEFSAGRLGEAARLIGQARRVALREQSQRLTYDIFERAADELRVGASRGTSNPFRAEAA